MKLLSSYFKELKIAARGFYFYIEVFMAVLILVILLVAVDENPTSNVKEFLYYDTSAEMKDYLIQEQIDEGKLVAAEPVEYKMKAASYEVKDKETGEVQSFTYDEETYRLAAYKALDSDTGKAVKTVYLAASEEEVIRLAWQEKLMGATIALDENSDVSYRYYIQGYETEKFENLLYVLHNVDPDTVEAAYNRQVVTRLGDTVTLNNRQNMVPIMIVFMGALMGFFIVMAYIFLDKDEGVIRAFVVTPSSVWKYLLSKTMVIMTTVLVSSSIIAIPIMGAQPNYLLFYTLLLVATFAFSALGLFVSSFFSSIVGAFGALYVFVIVLMLPAFSYFIPGFDPLWLRFFPTYPMLQGIKEALMVQPDVGYVLTYSCVFLAGGLALFLLANLRFKKTLTV